MPNITFKVTLRRYRGSRTLALRYAAKGVTWAR